MSKPFEWLQKQVPGAFRHEWHQHPYGEGWVSNFASVPDSACIAETAIVSEFAAIGSRSGIDHSARICEFAVLGVNVSIGRGAIIGRGVDICNRVTIASGAKWITAPLQIQGTCHILYVSAPGIIGVGCELHPVDWWLVHYRAVGRSNDYTKIQIAEYGMYLKIAARWMKVNKCLKAAK